MPRAAGRSAGDDDGRGRLRRPGLTAAVAAVRAGSQDGPPVGLRVVAPALQLRQLRHGDGLAVQDHLALPRVAVGQRVLLEPRGLADDGDAVRVEAHQDRVRVVGRGEVVAEGEDAAVDGRRHVGAVALAADHAVGEDDDAALGGVVHDARGVGVGDDAREVHGHAPRGVVAVPGALGDRRPVADAAAEHLVADPQRAARAAVRGGPLHELVHGGGESGRGRVLRRVLVAAHVGRAVAVVRQRVLVRHRADHALDAAGDADLLVRLELHGADDDVRLEDVAVDHVLVAPALVERLRAPRVVVHHAVARVQGVQAGEQAVAVQAHVDALGLVAPLDGADGAEVRGVLHQQAQVALSHRSPHGLVEVEQLARVRVAQHRVPVAELDGRVADAHAALGAGRQQDVVGERPEHGGVRAPRPEVLVRFVGPLLLHEVGEQEDAVCRA